MYSYRTFSFVIFAGGALWTPISCQRQVEFFYSPQNDTCAYGGQSFIANGNSDNGGVCAWAPADSRVYACPAPDPTCWSFDQRCSGGTTTAGPGQILCASAWCCLDTETCTTNPNQVNVCISDFSSPNSGVSAITAENVELQALGVSIVGTSVETANPSIFSTRIVDSTGAISTSSPTTRSSTTTTAVGSSGSKTGGASASASSTTIPASAPSTLSNSSGAGVSPGAIAGIVVGVIAVLAIAAFTIWTVMRRRNRRSPSQINDDHHRATEKGRYPPYNAQATEGLLASSKYQYQHQQQQPVHEADASNGIRTELPANPSPSELS